MKQYFAEIVQSDLSLVEAMCWEWDQMPSFGSLVVIEDESIWFVGLVTSLTTGSLDQTRKPFAYQKTFEELKKEQPQIFAFLTTTVEIKIVGWIDRKSKKIYYSLPRRPAKIHSFVRVSDELLAKHFLAKADFLHLFDFAAGDRLDEALLALVDQMYEKQVIDALQVQELVNVYARHVGADFRRLRLFCDRLQDLVIGLK
jgi:hypothetical protein